MFLQGHGICCQAGNDNDRFAVSNMANAVFDDMLRYFGGKPTIVVDLAKNGRFTIRNCLRRICMDLKAASAATGGQMTQEDPTNPLCLHVAVMGEMVGADHPVETLVRPFMSVPVVITAEEFKAALVSPDSLFCKFREGVAPALTPAVVGHEAYHLENTPEKGTVHRFLGVVGKRYGCRDELVEYLKTEPERVVNLAYVKPMYGKGCERASIKFDHAERLTTLLAADTPDEGLNHDSFGKIPWQTREILRQLFVEAAWMQQSLRLSDPRQADEFRGIALCQWRMDHLYHVLSMDNVSLTPLFTPVSATTRAQRIAVLYEAANVDWPPTPPAGVANHAQGEAMMGPTRRAAKVSTQKSGVKYGTADERKMASYVTLAKRLYIETHLRAGKRYCQKIRKRKFYRSNDIHAAVQQLAAGNMSAYFAANTTPSSASAESRKACALRYFRTFVAKLPECLSLVADLLSRGRTKRGKTWTALQYYMSSGENAAVTQEIDYRSAAQAKAKDMLLKPALYVKLSDTAKSGVPHDRSLHLYRLATADGKNEVFDIDLDEAQVWDFVPQGHAEGPILAGEKATTHLVEVLLPEGFAPPENVLRFSDGDVIERRASILALRNGMTKMVAGEGSVALVAVHAWAKSGGYVAHVLSIESPPGTAEESEIAEVEDPPSDGADDSPPDGAECEAEHETEQAPPAAARRKKLPAQTGKLVKDIADSGVLFLHVKAGAVGRRYGSKSVKGNERTMATGGWTVSTTAVTGDCTAVDVIAVRIGADATGFLRTLMTVCPGFETKRYSGWAQAQTAAGKLKRGDTGQVVATTVYRELESAVSTVQAEAAAHGSAAEAGPRVLGSPERSLREAAAGMEQAALVRDGYLGVFFACPHCGELLTIAPWDDEQHGALPPGKRGPETRNSSRYLWPTTCGINLREFTAEDAAKITYDVLETKARGGGVHWRCQPCTSPFIGSGATTQSQAHPAPHLE